METVIKTASVSTKIFLKLLKNMEVEKDGVDMVALKSNYGPYTIDVYMWSDDDSISFETFGFKSSKGWNELEPTEEQINTLTRIINNEWQCIADTMVHGDLSDKYQEWYLEDLQDEVRLTA